MTQFLNLLARHITEQDRISYTRQNRIYTIQVLCNKDNYTPIRQRIAEVCWCLENDSIWESKTIPTLSLAEISNLINRLTTKRRILVDLSIKPQGLVQHNVQAVDMLFIDPT